MLIAGGPPEGHEFGHPLLLGRGKAQIRTQTWDDDKQVRFNVLQQRRQRVQYPPAVLPCDCLSPATAR